MTDTEEDPPTLNDALRALAAPTEKQVQLLRRLTFTTPDATPTHLHQN